jgi:hypothetical protein
MTVDDLLIEARGVLPHRPGPAEALAVWKPQGKS